MTTPRIGTDEAPEHWHDQADPTQGGRLNWLRAAVLLPWALPTTVMALGWRWILNDPHGPINAVLVAAGRQPYGFLSTPATTWFAP